MKKKSSKAQIAEIEKRIEAQRRRALRPTTIVNAHATASKTLAEKKKSLERKARQRRWEED